MDWIVFRICRVRLHVYLVHDPMCELIQVKKQTILTLQCFSLIFLYKSFSKGFFVLDFDVKIRNTSCQKLHYFITKLIFVYFFLFQVLIFYFLDTGALFCFSLVASLCYNHRQKQDTAAHCCNVALTWKQSRFYYELSVV